MPTDRVARVLILPLAPDEWARLSARFPLTADEWGRLFAILRTMAPALVGEASEVSDDPA